MSIQVQLKRGVLANRPTLASGELYFATDSQQIAVGSAPVRFCPVVAVQDLTAQSAGLAALTIFTPTLTGFFRVSTRLKCTRAATTSSTLGGVTIGYTDGDDATIVSRVMGLWPTTGLVVAASSTANTAATQLDGSIVIYAKSGVSVNITIGYASSGTTTMQYSCHTRVEAL